MANEDMVSVIIPTYNREGTIEASVRSVLDQTYRNIEVLVVDDGSKDATREVVEGIDDGRIRYIYQNNAGACAARNRGIEYSKGEYIAFHDSDDLWHADKLDIQLECLKETKADIVCCQMERIGFSRDARLTPKLAESGFVSRYELAMGISTQTLLMRCHVAKVIRFDEGMPRLQDVEWLIRATEHYRLFAIKQALVEYQLSNDSISTSSDRLYRAICRILKKNPALKKQVPKVYDSLIQLLIDTGLEKYRNNDPECKRFLLLAARHQEELRERVKYTTMGLGIYESLRKLKDGLRGKK